jgi:hypothetical protein
MHEPFHAYAYTPAALDLAFGVPLLDLRTTAQTKAPRHWEQT